jgi:hypothetical protein
MAGSIYNLINNEFDYQDPYEEGLQGLGDDFYMDKQVNEDLLFEQGEQKWVN